MTNSVGKPTIPPWLYKLFTGHQYPYVRRLAKFGQTLKPGEDRPEPTREMIEAKFWEVYPRCRVKVLQEVKEGMIVVFHDLGEYPPGGFQELVHDPEAFLGRTFGKKKIKVLIRNGKLSSKAITIPRSFTTYTVSHTWKKGVKITGLKYRYSFKALK